MKNTSVIRQQTLNERGRRTWRVDTFFLTVTSLLLLPGEAAAVPAFARQTGMACEACHALVFPPLNAFGGAFKEGGYTMVGGQSMIEGEHLSLPMALNMSLLAKVRYEKTN
jgi:hypothetical protein